MGFPILHGSAPVAPEPVAPSDVMGLWRESSVVWEMARLVSAAPRLLRRATGRRTVVLVPGHHTSSRSMEPLRRFLEWRGHDARHWGLGTNRGDTEGDVLRMVPRLEAIMAESGKPAAMVGWSLGGVISRELARMRPDLVNRVITYGTPVIGGPTYTLGARAWGQEECARIARMVGELDRESPIEVPVTAVFSKRDRIVAWTACLDRWSLDVEHVEVGSGHLGMILDPDVWGVVVDRIETHERSGWSGSPEVGVAVKRVGAEGV